MPVILNRKVNVGGPGEKQVENAAWSTGRTVNVVLP